MINIDERGENIWWHYFCWRAFKNKIYKNVIIRESFLNDGKEVFINTCVKLVPTGTGKYSMYEDQPIGQKCFMAEKDGVKYLIPVEYKNDVPMRYADGFDCILKKSDPTVYKYIKSRNSTKITGVKTKDFRKFIDTMNDVEHTSNRDWTFMKITSIASLHKGIKACLCSEPECVDGETEFLSKSGWKKISEWQEGEMVMQFNKKDRTSNFIKPYLHIKSPSKGMFHIKNKFIDQVVSNYHRVLYEDLKNKLKVCFAKDFVEHHNKTTNGTHRKILTTFKPEINTSMNISLPELRVMVAVIADGTYTSKNKKQPNQVILRLKKQRKKDRIKELLEDANIEYVMNDYKDGYSHIRFVAPLKTKMFDKRFWSCNYTQIKTIANEVLKWDGTENDNTFRTTIKESADFIQYCLSSIGLRTSIGVNNRIGEKRGKYTIKSIEYKVHGTTQNKPSLYNSWNKNEIKKVESSDGFKYCFQVPSGYLVLRRNNKIFITGNCGKNANFTLLKSITGRVSRPPNATLAKIETEAYFNDVLIPDEMTSLGKAEIRNLEPFFLMLADESDEGQKHSMAQRKSMNTIDFSQLSCIFTYNRLQDVQVGSNFFDDIWTSIDAFKSRYPQIILKGKVVTSFPKLNMKEAKQIMEQNFDKMREFVKNLYYFKDNINDEMHGYNRSKLKMSGRHRVNFEGIIDGIDAYCKDQAEFDIWMEWINGRLNEYKVMLNGN